MSVTPEQAAAWEAEGRRLAPALDPVAAVIVAGADVVAAAHLALGLAAGQSVRRRVAVADLTGRATPLSQLVSDDDPHGLGDTFAFGVSLNRVARQLDQDGRLFVVPAGTEPALQGDSALSDRWRRIADGFRDVGALLIIVSPSAEPGLADLVTRMDGVVGADETPATIALPHRIITAALRQSPIAAPRHAPVIAPRSASSRVLRAALYALAALAVIAGLLWAARQVAGDGDSSTPLFTHTDSAAAELEQPAGMAGATPPSATDSARDTTAGAMAANAADDAAAAADASLEPPVANPADTVRAAAFAVAITSATSQSDATRSFRARPRSLAAVTIGEDADSAGVAHYYVVTGAGRRQSDATALLARMRENGLLGASAGVVVRLPFALQVESSVPRDSVRPVLNRFVSRGIPAYALLQPNGRAHVYVGAFARPADARHTLVTLQAAAIPAALAVRTGRPL
ncbi:MAG: hypothetical protein ACYC2G_06995 [Gemmatimonadaceae bacterium]